MFKAIQFPSNIEPLVRFVEDTEPTQIVEQCVDKLRNGTSVKEMITASALAIVRSTELPANHHGGPLHPICGIRAVSKVSQRLPGELSYLPVIQHVALCNNHTHSPQMGPYVMPELEPIEGSIADVGTYHISDVALQGSSQSQPTECADAVSSTKAAFERALLTHSSVAAEHYYLWLLDKLAPDQALEQLMPLAIERNNMDDHHFIYPVYTARALDELGWRWAHVLFRPTVRFQARQQSHLVEELQFDYANVQTLIDDYRLLEIDIPTETSEAESAAIGALAERMGRARNYLDNVETMARALADGLSLRGAGEALSVGSALAYLSTSYGNPMDSHLHTGTNNRRYLLSLPGISLKNKLAALLTGYTGPEVLLAESLLNWECNIAPLSQSSSAAMSQSKLLGAIIESIEQQPWLDWRAIGVDQVVASDEVKETVLLARRYAEYGYDPAVFFETMAEFSCRDDFAEMHSLKHFQAIVDEYDDTREPFKWVHLVAAAKSAAVIHAGREHGVYQRTMSLLKH